MVKTRLEYCTKTITKMIKKRSGNVKNGQKMVHKPEYAQEHLVKGGCPYRAGRSECQMGPRCLPEAAGPNKTVKNDKQTLKNSKRTVTNGKQRSRKTY